MLYTMATLKFVYDNQIFYCICRKVKGETTKIRGGIEKELT